MDRAPQICLGRGGRGRAVGRDNPCPRKQIQRARVANSKTIAAVVLIAFLASASRMFSFGAWMRSPVQPTPGPATAGVPTRVKYQVVDEPAIHGSKFGSRP